ncbi:MAG: efflux RND transporter permease subunit [Gemmatimonadota bacterium]|nr:MAG: efflux RND transporter permease subunit [Gemmatimonadota bacterium]
MIRLSIRRPVAISMAYFGVALLGVAAWRNIPIELLPNTDLPRLTVTTTWRGASPEAMEAFVTSPMESAIQLVRGVEKIESESADQYGAATAEIRVEFERETDMDFARLDLSERLTVLEDELPPGVDPPRVTPYVPNDLRDQTTPFLSYEMTGPYTQEALRAHVDDRVVPELLLVEGVATVDVRGGRDRVLQIELDERKINALGLNSFIVAQRISELEYVAEAGAVEMDGLLRTVAIRHNTKSAEEIRRTPLLTDRGRIVRVEDVAVVHDTYEEARTYNRINAQPAISFRIYKEIGVNTVEVADRVKVRLEEVANLHPVGVELILDQDESEDIKKQLQDLRIRAIVAAAVIFVVLLVFLRSFRSAAIVFMTIAFSILIALNLIYFGGFTLNVLTLMGLAMGFGLIVDNAIVVLENIYRKRQHGEEPVAAAEHGAREVVLPILAATLTTVIVFIPFVYLQGELRVFYVPLAIVVGMALIASLFVAFSFIPGLASKVLTGRRFEKRNGAENGTPEITEQSAARRPIYVRFYAAILGFTLRLTKRRGWPVLPLATVGIAVILFGMSYYVFNKYVNRGVVWGRWGGSDTYIQIYIRLPRGAELERVDELTRFFEDKLKPMPEIERFTATVWPEFSSMRVTFPDSLEQTMVPVAIKEQMLAYSYLFGGAEVRVYGYGPSFYGGGGGSPNYTIKVLGYNYERVREIAEDLGQRLERFSRVRDVDVNSMGYFVASRDKVIEFALAVDRQRLGLHGITTADVVYQVASAVPGQGRSSQIRIDGEEVRYEVKLEDYEEFDVLQLKELLIRAPTGEGVRLGDVATLAERQVLNRVVREDQQYRRNVSYEFRGPSKLGDRVQEAVINATDIPDGYRIEGRDEWRWEWEEEKQIWTVLAIALVLVFMVTSALFESLRQPLCVLLTVPMALIGVFLMFFYAEASFTREAYIGVIMMGGIVVNNAILLVDHVNHLRRNEGLALQEATLRGTLERVRPILMTSTTTIFGLLPLVLFSEYADANIWNALGYALIGGLASSTILVLTVTPALYLMFELRPEKRRERALRLAQAEVVA